MASLQQRSGWFHLLFRFNGRQFSHALKTQDRREADAIQGSEPLGVALWAGALWGFVLTHPLRSWRK